MKYCLFEIFRSQREKFLECVYWSSSPNRKENSIRLNIFRVIHYFDVFIRKMFRWFLFSFYWLFIISLFFFRGKSKRKHRFQSRFFTKLDQLKQSISIIIRIFIFLDRLIRNIFDLIEQLYRIIYVINGWIRLIRSICSALHLISSRLMFLSFTFYRIFHSMTILFRPLINRSIDRAATQFSRCLFDYYSSNGACYTLKARTHHIFCRFRERWKKKSQSNQVSFEIEIFYDALDDESFYLEEKKFSQINDHLRCF